VERLGTLARLRRYPVKSMMGEDLSEARVTTGGLEGDRVHAFVDKRNQSDFPWMTGRQGHDLILFRPRFLADRTSAAGNSSATRYATEVTTPEGLTLRLEDPEFTHLLESRYGRSLELRSAERGMMDAAPVSIFGLATAAKLSEETGLELDPLRFRSNFYVHWESDRPFFEDNLVGGKLQVGAEVRLQVMKRDTRCIMISLDPRTAASAPQVLERVTRLHERCAGVYAVVECEGTVRTGDSIYAV